MSAAPALDATPLAARAVALRGDGVASRCAAALLEELGARVHRRDGPPDRHPAESWARHGLMALTGERVGPPRMIPSPLAACADAVVQALAALGAELPDPAHQGAARLAERGLAQYEVANFARPGAESRHNRGYWRRQPWLGLGPGAHGAWGRCRLANPDRIEDWQSALDRGELPAAAVDRLSVASRRLERVILALRTREGVPLVWLPPGALDLPRGEREGLWTVADGRLRLAGAGYLRIDTVEEALARRL